MGQFDAPSPIRSFNFHFYECINLLADGKSLLSLLTHQMCALCVSHQQLLLAKSHKNRNPNAIGSFVSTHESVGFSLAPSDIGKFGENTHRIESQQDYMEIEMWPLPEPDKLDYTQFLFRIFVRNDFIVRT